MILATHTLSTISHPPPIHEGETNNPPRKNMPISWHFCLFDIISLHNWGTGRHKIKMSVPLLKDERIIIALLKLMHFALIPIS